MKFCYQVATPDVTYGPHITAFQGELENSLSFLKDCGYDGVEFMTRSPENLDWDHVLKISQAKDMPVVLVCTGEIFAQLGVSFCDPTEEGRKLAIVKTKQMIDYASHLGAIINVGRLKGEYVPGVPHEDTQRWAVEAFRELGEYGVKKNVDIAIETVAKFQTNFVNNLEQAKAIVDAVQCPAVRVMMDVFHMQQEEPDYLKAIELYKDINIHVHLADNNRHFPGDGDLPFDKIIEAFAKTGYDGAFTTEITQVPSQEEAALGAMKHMAPIFHKYYGRAL